MKFDLIDWTAERLMPWIAALLLVVGGIGIAYILLHFMTKYW